MPDKIEINQNIMDVIKNSGYSLGEFAEGCRRLIEEINATKVKEESEVGSEPITLRHGRVYRKSEGEWVLQNGPIELPVKKGSYETSLSEWSKGSVIGKAMLVPTGSNGIFIVKMEIDGQDVTGTGVVHFPVRDGDVIDAMYVKEN
jgi:hypothetical protein